MSVVSHIIPIERNLCELLKDNTMSYVFNSEEFMHLVMLWYRGRAEVDIKTRIYYHILDHLYDINGANWATEENEYGADRITFQEIDGMSNSLMEIIENTYSRVSPLFNRLLNMPASAYWEPITTYLINNHLIVVCKIEEV